MKPAGDQGHAGVQRIGPDLVDDQGDQHVKVTVVAAAELQLP